MTQAPDANQHLLIRTCRGETVERAPVWAMRQAGRWDPEFRKLREGHTFYEMSENAELAARASLCPLRFGVDAIILFYDITTLAVAMGQKFDLVPERGPVPHQPIRSVADVRRLARHPDELDFRYVLEELRLVRESLAGSLPVLVFAGAPFTLAAYQLSMSKEFDRLREAIADTEHFVHELFSTTCAATIDFLNVLMNAGADAYQLFDSWAGVLSENEYRQCAHAWHEQIFAEVKGPSILFVKDNPHLDLSASSGANVISLGACHDLAAVKQRQPLIV